jgi:putative tryptophan/tyrosine transport system substrate-binding protein
MRRREFIALAGGAASWPLSGKAQPKPKQGRIGFLEPGTREANGRFLASFRTGMAAHGWIEG